MTTTPCVNKCKLDKGICTGCGRTLGEISRWSTFNEKKRIRLMRIASQRMAMKPKKAEGETN